MTEATRAPLVLMVGGGQLSRMTHQAAIALGVRLRVLAAAADDSAAQVAADVALGHHDDQLAVLAAALDVDVVTFDHEHVPQPILHQLEATSAAVRPGADALLLAQDKIVMRRRLAEIGAPIPAWQEIASAAEAEDFAGEHGWPVVLKVARGGYDGRGVWLCQSVAEVATAMASLQHGRWLLEARVPFVRELCAQVACSATGELAFYPVVETVQRDGMCDEVLAPAPNLTSARIAEAQQIARLVATEIGVVGMLAVELFDTGEQILVNELAMRPHNSGHWTIEGAVTSQFENHLRAVLGFPLGSTEPRADWAVMVNIVGTGNPVSEVELASALLEPNAKIHLYGKAARPGRKIGHVTVTGGDMDEARRIARDCANQIAGTD